MDKEKDATESDVGIKAETLNFPVGIFGFRVLSGHLKVFILIIITNYH